MGYLERNLRKNPENIQLYLDLFQAHFHVGELEKAGKNITQALSLQGDNIEVLKSALFYYREIGNLNKQTEICNTLLSLNPDDFAFKRQMARLLMEQQMYTEAGNLINELLMHTPNDSELQVAQAKIMTLQGLPSKAVIQLQQVLATDPNNAMAHFELGRTYYAQKEWNKAVVEFKKAVNLGIDDSKAFIELGEIYALRGFFENALESYQRAATLDKENIQINMEIAELYFKLNMPEKALLEYEALQDKQPANIKMNLRLAQVYQTNRMFQKAVELLSHLLEDNAKNAEILFELGKTYLYLKERDTAQEYFEKVLKIDPKHIRAQVELSVLEAKIDPQKAIQTLKQMIQRSPTRDSFVYLSRVYIENNMIDQAVAEFKVLTKTYPESAPTWAELGKLYTVLSKAYDDPKIRQSGLDALNKSVSLDDNYSLAYFYLGESYHLSDNLDASLVNLKKAYQLDPQNIEIKEFLNSVENQKISIEIRSKLDEAKTYLSRGMDQNAIIEYEAILELDQFHSEANYDLASIYIKQENFDLAKTYLINSTEKNKEFVQAFFDLARIYRQEENLYQAELELIKILDLHPQDYEANLLMGIVLSEADEVPESAIYLQKAIEINPSSAKAYYEMGRMFLRIGEKDQTKEFYEKCYKLDSSITEVNDFFVQLDQEETAQKLENLLNQARDAESSEEWELARGFYEDILSLQPSHFYARYRAGDINERLGRFSEACFDYQQAYNQYEDNKHEFRDLPVKLGLLLSKLGRREEAIPVLEEAIEVEPNHEVLYLKLLTQYKEYFLQSKNTDFEGRTPETILGSFDDRTNANPNSLAAWICLGYSYRINLLSEMELDKGFSQGIEAYQKAYQIDATNDHVLFNLGLLHHFTGKVAKAKEYLKSLVQIQPDHIKAYKRLAVIYEESKEFDQAIKVYKKLIDLEPENGLHRMDLIDLYKVIANADNDKEGMYAKFIREYEQSAKSKGDCMSHFDFGYAILTLNSEFSLNEESSSHSISEFKSAVAAAPNNPWGYWGLKRVYNKESIAGKPRYQEAVEICRKALEMSPDTPQAHLELANALNEDHETNRKAEAMENYKKAVHFDNECTEAYFKLASIFRIRQQHEDAVEYYRRVIELDPTTEMAKNARRSLVHIDKSRADA